MKRKPGSAVFLCGFFSLLLGLLSDAIAARVDSDSYDYPYENPYLATMTVAIMKGRPELAGGEINNLDIRILNGRDYPYPLETKGTLRFRFYRRSTPSPLIFVIPGLGSSAFIGAALYLADVFVDHGFHVIVLPSPFNWNFTLAASRSGVPGLTSADSEDLYAAMQKVLDYIRDRYQIEAGKIGLVGLSDGAVQAAFVSDLDAKVQKLGIDTVLLVNPPVDRLEAIETIDRMSDAHSLTRGERGATRTYGLGVAADALQGDVTAPDYFADWDRRLRLTDVQMKFLIGNVMHSAIGDTIYMIDRIHGLDFLDRPITRIYRTGRLKEARSYSLMDYTKLVLLPHLTKTGNHPTSLESLNAETSLWAVQNILQNNPKIFLMHNGDDFLISDEDLGYLENVFGDRAMIYPHGGHLGNLWYSRNTEDMLNIFRPLLQGGR